MAQSPRDAAAERRRQLAAQLLRGEEVIVTQQGAIRPLSERDDNEVAITVPEGKLAAPSLYWYERDPDLLKGEEEAMQRFFPQFRSDRLSDGRLSWLGSMASGIPGSERIWHLQVVYDHDHPHNDDHAGSIQVFPIEPDLVAISEELGETDSPIRSGIPKAATSASAPWRLPPSAGIPITPVRLQAHWPGRPSGLPPLSSGCWASSARTISPATGSEPMDASAPRPAASGLPVPTPQVVFSRRAHAAIVAETFEQHPNETVVCCWDIASMGNGL